ncbi:MAG TPA: hypothetical protein VD837_11935 [Terriglobales bacterium]|nr:hypothetical protein [Terriglobales bacterium]
MSVYDPKVQLDFAELLTKRSKRITMVYTIMAAIVGAGAGVAVSYIRVGEPRNGWILLWTVILAFFGFVMGKERAFNLRLKAQELLCQKQIAENTTPKETASAAAAK